MKPIAVSAFYKFVALPDQLSLRATLLEACRNLGIRGTILLATEGINGTIAGEPAQLAAAMAFIRSLPPFLDLESKESEALAMPFKRMKVRLKTEIVTMGVPDIDPKKWAGTYVEPTAWNGLIADPDVLVIDTRNSFEVSAGTFSGAVDPGTRSFSEFPQYVERHLDDARRKKIAMFCTGGIRCEKATSYMRRQGFEQVFHLKGGILKYLETVSKEQSLWNGRCFVFDERETLGHGLTLEDDPTPE